MTVQAWVYRDQAAAFWRTISEFCRLQPEVGVNIEGWMTGHLTTAWTACSQIEITGYLYVRQQVHMYSNCTRVNCMRSNHAVDELQLLFIWKNCQRDLEKWLAVLRNIFPAMDPHKQLPRNPDPIHRAKQS
jgi:hypothetical protein